ncbi:MAG: DUF1573 domain-containing protein [Parafilimonas sp.]|nr:DUF1573 domain-containing protein [Parafilimonas sp.]
MNFKIIIFFIFFVCILIACNNYKNPYQNDKGIDPLLIAAIDTAHYTLIKWEDSLIDFGAIKTGDSVQIKFNFKNIGNTPLFILKVRASCWCVQLNFPKDPIMPGGSGMISATIKNSSYKGFLHKTISITTNTKIRSNYTLVLQGKLLE